MQEYSFYPDGDSALLIVFGDTVSPEINRRVSDAARGVREAKIGGVVDMIPAFASLMIQYDPLVLSYDELCLRVAEVLRNAGTEAHSGRRVYEIPVCYGGTFGPDLDYIASHAGMTTREVVEIHTSRDYLIYMLGFLPGFCYLGGLDERIHTPRLETPRLRIPAGSVGIGGSQTGIYPLDSPGGWQLMGQTPVKTYDPEREPPIFLQAGDYIRFTEIDEGEYEQVRTAVEKGEYRVRVQME